MKINAFILALGIMIFTTQAAFQMSDYLVNMHAVIRSAPAIKKIDQALVGQAMSIAVNFNNLVKFSEERFTPRHQVDFSPSKGSASQSTPYIGSLFKSNKKHSGSSAQMPQNTTDFNIAN